VIFKPFICQLPAIAWSNDSLARAGQEGQEVAQIQKGKEIERIPQQVIDPLPRMPVSGVVGIE